MKFVSRLDPLLTEDSSQNPWWGREFVAQSGKRGELAIVTAENALPYERPPLSKSFLAGREQASDIRISDAAFYRKNGIAVFQNFPVGKVDFRRHRLQGPSGKMIGSFYLANGSPTQMEFW